MIGSHLRRLAASLLPTRLRMKLAWERRARENALHYIADFREQWENMDEFFLTGEHDTARVLELAGWSAERMAAARLLEIGCGAGRMTRALAKRFAQVDGIDISSTMIDLAREHNGGISNARFHIGSGTDLKPFAHAQFDFVLSYIVFQHIPTAAAIHGYIEEALRVLKPGGEFFFQARNDAPDGHGDTYNGASITLDQVQSIATRHGRTASIRDGAGQHYCYFTIK